jgi:hypothetical protein
VTLDCTVTNPMNGYYRGRLRDLLCTIARREKTEQRTLGGTARSETTVVRGQTEAAEKLGEGCQGASTSVIHQNHQPRTLCRVISLEEGRSIVARTLCRVSSRTTTAIAEREHIRSNTRIGTVGWSWKLRGPELARKQQRVSTKRNQEPAPSQGGQKMGIIRVESHLSTNWDRRTLSPVGMHRVRSKRIVRMLWRFTLSAHESLHRT